MRARGYHALVAMVVTVAMAPSAAMAQPCGSDQRAWVDDCARTSGVSVRAARCPAGRLIAAGGGADSVEVEIHRGDEGLVRAGPYALSPIGEFPDWAAEPAERRAVLDALAACAVAAQVPLSADDSAPVGRDASRREPVLPWLLLLALIGVGALAVAGRPRPRRAVELGALALGTAAARLAVVPFGFFHQAGQGPMWIDYALGGSSSFDAYGPGYRELFSALAAAVPNNPDGAVFAAQAALGALVPVLVWIIARRAGARPAVCWAISLVVAVDPTLIRIAHSESYTAILVTLVAMATAVAMQGAHRATPRSWRMWVGFGVAGLAIAQAARVHPSCWVPAALLPLAVFVVPAKDARDRLVRAAASAAVVGVVVAVTSLGAMIDVLQSNIVPDRLDRRMGAPPMALVAAAVAAIGLAAWQLERTVAGLCAVVGGAVAACAMVATNPLPYDYAAYQHPIFRMYAPVLVAMVAGVAARIDARTSRSSRALAAVAISIGVIGAAHAAARWSDLTRRPTDVHESLWVRTWRGDLPPGASIAYLSRAGDRTYALPIYPVDDGPIPIALDAERAATIALAPGSYYYRSSLCSTPEGTAACRSIEGRYSLVPVDRRSYDAVASQPWAPVDRPADVGLYRVER